MEKFIFTPGQKEEAMLWYKANCLDYHKFLASLPEPLHDDVLSIGDCAIDTYFKLKNVNFNILPSEFIVGIEYKNQEEVIKGDEKINIRFQNPHKNNTADQFAQAVLMELLQRIKG